MTRLAAAAAAAFLAVPLAAADWPQYLGPNRDAVWTETGVLKEFPPGGPKVLWRAPVGGGYAGPAVVGGKVFVADKVMKAGVKDPDDPFAGAGAKTPATERVLCLDAKTGKEVWKHEHEVTYAIQYPAGPRCTPTVSGGKVYAVGAMGDFFCLDAGTGKKLWEKNFPKDYGAKVQVWGFAGHPVIYQDLVICLVGGEGSTVVAFNKDTGAEAWKALSASDQGYNTPAVIRAGGTDQLVVWTPRALYGLNPTSGSKYWDVPLQPEYGMSIMSPRQDGDLLYAAGIGNVGVTLKLDATKPAVTEVWRGKGGPRVKEGLFPVNMTPFAEKGVLYGADQPGQFRAIELATGKRLWSTFKPVFGEEKDEDFNKGASGTAFVVKNADRFYLFSETGDLIIAKLSPQGYEEVSRAHILEPTGPSLGRKVVWSHPAYADRCAFLRNDKELVCVSLAAE
ncbi:MAG TPA: PQQ-binding-like beta-propeller repeat protein [Urbifossiella sp.]|jgi:outer membrane protein assembly factor BamB|nr:PQQ-binding-like beta-propeller repeat protein [Urbifossiella sp.]